MEKNRVSNSTDMILNMQGGFITMEHGGVETKVLNTSIS